MSQKQAVIIEREECIIIVHNLTGAGPIMKAVVPVLLCLLPALVEVHSQTVPYVSFMGTNLTNHSYVNLTLVGSPESGGDSVQCHTNLATCCSANQGAHRGDWYFPNGDRLPFSGGIYEQRDAHRVDLRRRNNSASSGVYCCNIETVHDDGSDTTTQGTVYVGLYTSGGEYMYCHHNCISSWMH